MTWQTVFTQLGGFAILVAALGWTLRALIGHFLGQDVESYKARIKAEADRQLEELKADLRVEAHRQELVFSTLHTRRLEEIVTVYESLTQLRQNTHHLLSVVRADEKPETQALTDFVESYLGFGECLSNKRIWFTPELVQQMVDFQARAIAPMLTANGGGEILGEGVVDVDAIKGRLPAIQKELLALQQLIETEFRRLLGVVPAPAFPS